MIQVLEVAGGVFIGLQVSKAVDILVGVFAVRRIRKYGEGQLARFEAMLGGGGQEYTAEDLAASVFTAARESDEEVKHGEAT